MNRVMPIMSPNEVIAMTSGENIELDATRITLQVILIAQRRYIQPALGADLYRAITQGKYVDFTHNYIKPALAFFIAKGLIYNHTIRIGAGGVAIPVPQNHVKPSQKELSQIINTLKKEAETTLKIAIEYIIDSNLFPEFSIVGSTYKTSTIGGVVIV